MPRNQQNNNWTKVDTTGQEWTKMDAGRMHWPPDTKQFFIFSRQKDLNEWQIGE